MRSLAVAAVLLSATTASAGDLCVNYVACQHMEASEWGQQCSKSTFISFNPRTRTSVVVANIDSIPDWYDFLWDRDFSVLSYTVSSGSYKVPNNTYRLEWKVGAVPTMLPPKDLPPKDRVGDPFPHPSPAQSQSLGKVWNSFLWDAYAPTPNVESNRQSLTFDAPDHRKIEAGDDSGDTYEAFGTPVSWTNTATGEKKVLTLKPVPDETGGGSHPLAISTADNFILIAEKFSGADAIVADMNSGEVLLRAGDQSGFAGWGKCPAK
ncbi:MAG: hypothetical protein LC687_05085 [Actinobacteria bacterium]|nr:hypothetical protein [Actinomycetota bacterium]